MSIRIISTATTSGPSCAACASRLHWFNPLVWWAAALSRTDAELFCDEDTVRRLGEDVRADYGRSLIRMTCRERVDPLSAATTMSGRGGQLKTRIISITKHPKTAIPVLILRASALQPRQSAAR